MKNRSVLQEVTAHLAFWAQTFKSHPEYGTAASDALFCVKRANKELLRNRKDKKQLKIALDLLERSAAVDNVAPDANWYRDYYLLTGEHMILTEEGWTPPYPGCEEEVLAEVNAPKKAKRLKSR